MIAVSKVEIINKYREPIKWSEWVLHKNGKDYVEKVHKEPVYFCKIGDEVGLVTKCKYVYKEGYFYVVINKKNVTFLIDEKGLKIDGEFIPDIELRYTTKEHKFTDFEDFKFF